MSDQEKGFGMQEEEKGPRRKKIDFDYLRYQA